MRISVVIPLYNKRDTVARALESVFAQTVQPFEIIVVNDGSTDGLEQIVEQINYPLVRLIHQSNAGVSAARNKGIDTAKGDWIAFLDADDEWKPEFLETMQMLALTYPECKVVASTYEMQDYQGIRKPIILKEIPFTGEHGILSNYFEVAACSHPPLWTSAVIAKKDALQSMGGFPVGIKAGEDLITWARLAVKFKIGYSMNPLSVFIQDAAHTYNDKPNRLPDPEDRVGKDLIKLLDVLNPEGRKGLSTYISHWYKMRASIYLRLGAFQPALKQCYSSLKYQPSNKIIYIYLLVAFLPLTLRNRIFRKFAS